MTRIVRRAIGVGIVLCLFGGKLDAGELAETEALVGKEWQALATITGFHSIRLKKAGLEVRLLEADGSASVAQDPVALYLVVTNNGTADLVERVWRVPRGVARVRHLAVNDCGVSVAVDVDRSSEAGRTGRSPRTLQLCFLSRAGTTEATLKATEVRP